jgi:hypothetical protein
MLVSAFLNEVPLSATIDADTSDSKTVLRPKQLRRPRLPRSRNVVL